MKKALLVLILFLFIPIANAKVIEFNSLFDQETPNSIVNTQFYSGDKFVNLDTKENSLNYNIQNSGAFIYGDYSSEVGFYTYVNSSGDPTYKTDFYTYNYRIGMTVSYYRANGDLVSRINIGNQWNSSKYKYTLSPNEFELPKLDGNDVLWTIKYIATSGETSGDNSIQVAFVAEENKSSYQLECGCRDDKSTAKLCTLKYNSIDKKISNDVNILKSIFSIDANDSTISNIKDANSNSINPSNNILEVKSDYKENSVIDIMSFELDSDKDKDTLFITLLKSQEGFEKSGKMYLQEKSYEDLTLNIDYSNCQLMAVKGEEIEIKENPNTGIKNYIIYIIPITVLLIVSLYSLKTKGLFKKI